MKHSLIALIAVSAFAASQMEGPSLGWLWDSEARQLRRLAGLPGSLRNEAGLDLGEGVLSVWIAAGQSEAVIAREGGIVERRNLLSGEVTTLSLEAPDAVIFSPDGKKAAMWWKAAGKVQVWGEEALRLNANALALQNDGELLVLEDAGVLRNARGAWLGAFGDDAKLSSGDGMVVIAAKGALVRLEREGTTWIEKARRQDDRLAGFTQIELESKASVLTVGTKGEVYRWTFEDGDPGVLAESGVKRLIRLRQGGFYLAEGESIRILFALNEGQKLYELPGGELR